MSLQFVHPSFIFLPVEDYAVMCNLRGSGSVRHPYGQDALVARPGHEYEVPLEYDPQVLPPNPNFYEDYDDSNSE